MSKKKTVYTYGECDWSEYDKVADTCAKDKNYTTKNKARSIKMWGVGHPFPAMYISRATRIAINYDRDAFVGRIHAFAYAGAMEKLDMEDDSAWRNQTLA